jgi:hypothetical protein
MREPKKGSKMAKPNKDKLKEFFVEHLPYEIDMLRDAYVLLETGLLGRVLENLLIESFCVHARNLIEYLPS